MAIDPARATTPVQQAERQITAQLAVKDSLYSTGSDRSSLGSRSVTNETGSVSSLSERISSAWQKVRSFFSFSHIATACNKLKNYFSKEAFASRAAARAADKAHKTAQKTFKTCLKEAGLSKAAIKDHFDDTEIDSRLTPDQIKAKAGELVQIRKREAFNIFKEAVNEAAEFRLSQDDKNSFLLYAEVRLNMNLSNTELRKAAVAQVDFLAGAIQAIRTHRNTGGPYGVHRSAIFQHYCQVYRRNRTIQGVLQRHYNEAETRSQQRAAQESYYLSCSSTSGNYLARRGLD